jgi:hypothetical protein
VRAGVSALLAGAFLFCRGAAGLETMPPAAYELHTETVMPHLEENLRYADTYEKRCLRTRRSPRHFRSCRIRRWPTAG